MKLDIVDSDVRKLHVNVKMQNTTDQALKINRLKFQLFVFHFVKTFSEVCLFFVGCYILCSLRTADALHVACAIFMNCDYVLTTDRKILNKSITQIPIVNPIEFLQKEVLYDF
ncbi:MAG: hypothetical protein LBQ66_12115 [Planctomycetaceae bacterium]|nr:hypothetical protein [Planctomycetaceae bacterium]